MRSLLARGVSAAVALGASLPVQVAVALGVLVFLPIAGLGWTALQSVGRASRETATLASISMADATATVLSTYIATAAHDLKFLADSLASSPTGPFLDPQLRRYVIDFPQFRSLALIDSGHRVVSSSIIVGRPAELATRPSAGQVNGVIFTTVTVDNALLPIAQLIVPIVSREQRTLVADLNLEYLWHVVHTLRLPPHADAMLVDDAGRVMAHTSPAKYPAVARGLDLRQHPLLRRRDLRVATYLDSTGVEQLAIASPLRGLPWTLLIEQETSAVDDPALTAQRHLRAALALTLLGTVFALAFFSRTLTVPLQDLTRATQTLARGEHDVRLRVPRHREMGKLVRAFQYLAGKLSELELTVRRQEREVVLGQIGAGLLHDIAHPIRNIVNNARLLPRLGDDEARGSLQLIEREYEVIEELMDNLKQFSRTGPLLAEAVSPHLVVLDIMGRLRRDAESRGVTLQAFASPDLPPIPSDARALRRVLRNLIFNGIEASQRSKGTVTLTADENGSHLRLTVADTGPGLDAHALSHLFDPFRSTKRKGLGLGLATAKRLVEQMGGTLTATSRVGNGTSCVVSLPRTPDVDSPVGGTTREDTTSHLGTHASEGS